MGKGISKEVINKLKRDIKNNISDAKLALKQAKIIYNSGKNKESFTVALLKAGITF